MEDIGILKSKYYVTKIDSIFSKHRRVLWIHELGISFKARQYEKSKKNPDTCLFKDILGITLSGSNDIQIKGTKQSFSIVCIDRINLMVDLLMAKDLHDMKFIPAMNSEINKYKCTKEIVPNDPSSNTPVEISFLSSTIMVQTEKIEEKGKNGDNKYCKYFIRYNDIIELVSTSHGIIIHTKVYLFFI